MELEKQIATEKEFDKYVLEKINKNEDTMAFFDDFVQKEDLKKNGSDLKYYREGDRVYYSFSIK